MARESRRRRGNARELKRALRSGETANEGSAPVGPGSMIFLPIRQPHCLECEDDDGMELVGIFYPAGSPAVNYAAT